jgi:oxepin-CoA hydrolase/3-oxo-5,6-dehydrosuberyl-CoA semialdehyde dehydrogenase
VRRSTRCHALYAEAQSSKAAPDILTAISGTAWVPGAREIKAEVHPFTKVYGDLADWRNTAHPARSVTRQDIETFAHGDTFYAHMDDDAAEANPFFQGRVAHGYLPLSFAVEVFVHLTWPGPGQHRSDHSLRFMKPVSLGDSIAVRLTVKKKKTPRNDEYAGGALALSLAQSGRWSRLRNTNCFTMNAFLKSSPYSTEIVAIAPKPPNSTGTIASGHNHSGLAMFRFPSCLSARLLFIVFFTALP